MTSTQAEIDALLAQAQESAPPTGVDPEAGGPDLQPGRTDNDALPLPGAVAVADDTGIDPRVRRILNIEVPLMVVLARRKMAVREILNICIGSIIEFEKPFDEELELLVNNRSIAFGHAVKIGEKFGLRIMRIGDVKARIDALGT